MSAPPGVHSIPPGIHPTAIVAPGAQIPASCTVGPYSTIGHNVILGEDCNLITHVVLDGHLTLGRGNTIYPFACVGVAPCSACQILYGAKGMSRWRMP